MGFDILHTVLLVFMWHELHMASPPVFFRFILASISIRESRRIPSFFPADGSAQPPHTGSYDCTVTYRGTDRSTVSRSGSRSGGSGDKKAETKSCSSLFPVLLCSSCTPFRTTRLYLMDRPKHKSPPARTGLRVQRYLHNRQGHPGFPDRTAT